MNTRNRFREYMPDQLLLLPPDMKDWLPEDHLTCFISDVVDTMGLSAIEDTYDGSQGGQPAYHPRMMVKLLLYAYCVGVPSSRKIERNTYESIPFRVLTADQHPDHDTVAEFRRRHLTALAGLFVEVLQLCREAGLVKLGHIALDGTKVRANASKHKAMSYGRMEKKAQELEAEVAELLARAQTVDEEEDARYGRGKRGDELPKELRFKQSRLAKIREAKRVLEEEARFKAEHEVKAVGQREAAPADRKTGSKDGAKPSAGRPKAKAQRNFTDPDSRIMRDGATKSFGQSYNCQVAVDSKCQVIVACGVTQQHNDKKQVQPMVERAKANLGGRKPKRMSADTGYFSGANVEYLQEEGVDPYIATGKMKHGENVRSPRGRIPKGLTVKERMTRKLRTVKGRCTYSKRKGIVEPVIGQIKSCRGYRQFLLRGLGETDAEWSLICLTHNLLKLFRYYWQPGLA